MIEGLSPVKVNKDKVAGEKTQPRCEKFMRYKEDISKNTKNFEENVKSLYLAECDEKIQTILLFKESDFLKSITDGVKSILEEMYGGEVFNER